MNGNFDEFQYRDRRVVVKDPIQGNWIGTITRSVKGMTQIYHEVQPMDCVSSLRIPEENVAFCSW